jgi:hypothetical protein
MAWSGTMQKLAGFITPVVEKRMRLSPETAANYVCLTLSRDDMLA